MTLSLLPSEEKVQIMLDNVQDRETSIFFDEHKNISRLPIYTQADSNISGVLRLKFSDNKYIKHNGIFIQLIGETENYHKKDSPDLFLIKNQELEPPGKHKGQLDYPFTFENFEKKYETYYGLAGRIRYYLKAVVVQEIGSHITNECEFAVQLPIMPMMFPQSFEIQLRIADYLMVNVALNKTSMHMEECLIGKIMVEQIRLMIKKIQVSIIKREITNPTPLITCTKEDIVVKQELLSKCPKKGDIIPFKINLGALDLSPNLTQPNSKIVMKYILIMSFIDEDERSLFKPIDINIWRRR